MGVFGIYINAHNLHRSHKTSFILKFFISHFVKKMYAVKVCQNTDLFDSQTKDVPLIWTLI